MGGIAHRPEVGWVGLIKSSGSKGYQMAGWGRVTDARRGEVTVTKHGFDPMVFTQRASGEWVRVGDRANGPFRFSVLLFTVEDADRRATPALRDALHAELEKWEAGE